MSVNMSKGQRISLEKPGSRLAVVRMGLGWDAVKKRGLFGAKQQEIDLDASCVLLASGKPADTVYFGKLTSDDGAVRHTGDNLTGAGDGDDESILVDLSRVPDHVTALIFTVSSFQGQTFDEVANAYCRLVDESSGTELARYELSGGGAHTGMVMAKVYRHTDGWRLNAIGEPASGRTLRDLMPAVLAHA